MNTHYTDNTLADHPPGGKDHAVTLDTAGILPSDLWRERHSKKQRSTKRGSDQAASESKPL